MLLMVSMGLLLLGHMVGILVHEAFQNVLFHIVIFISGLLKMCIHYMKLNFLMQNNIPLSGYNTKSKLFNKA